MATSLNLWVAFGAGLLSFLSPCILPLAPGYLAIISGVSFTDLTAGRGSRRRLLRTTTAFIVGFMLVFMVLGISSSFLGGLFRAARRYLMIGGGIVVTLLGLHQTGWLPIPWLYRERRIGSSGRVRTTPSTGIMAPFLSGLAFAFGWTPCVGPILGSILALAGVTGDPGRGVILLAGYSMGLAVPFFLLALVFDRAVKGLNRIKPYLGYLEWGSGILLIMMGLLLLSGGFAGINSWLLRFTGGWNPEEWIK